MTFARSNMRLTSSAFQPGAKIPVKYTGEGTDVSPPLQWENPPNGTRSYALFCHDPDAPLVSAAGNYGFVHWVLYNIPPSVTRLDEGVAQFTHGKNNYDREGYGGPMPPNGHGRHYYYFWILALDLEPSLANGFNLWELLKKIEPNVLGMNRLVGTYERE